MPPLGTLSTPSPPSGRGRDQDRGLSRTGGLPDTPVQGGLENLNHPLTTAFDALCRLESPWVIAPGGVNRPRRGFWGRGVLGGPLADPESGPFSGSLWRGTNPKVTLRKILTVDFRGEKTTLRLKVFVRAKRSSVDRFRGRNFKEFLGEF